MWHFQKSLLLLFYLLTPFFCIHLNTYSFKRVLFPFPWWDTYILLFLMFFCSSSICTSIFLSKDNPTSLPASFRRSPVFCSSFFVAFHYSFHSNSHFCFPGAKSYNRLCTHIHEFRARILQWVRTRANCLFDLDYLTRHDLFLFHPFMAKAMISLFFFTSEKLHSMPAPQSLFILQL